MLNKYYELMKMNYVTGSKQMKPCFVLAMIVAVLASGCGGKPVADTDEWKEMDEFHLVMADVFHPLKDSGNVAPIRAHAEELAESAAKWASAVIPRKVDNDETKGMLEKLKNGTRDLADEIKNGAADDGVSAQLTELHELFHHIQERWYGAGAEHQDH